MEQQNVWQKTFFNWVPLGAAVVIMSGLVYGAVQQTYRQGANDPQIQVAEDVVTAINQGSASPESIVPPQPTADMAGSLSTFLLIYNATGTPVGGSVALNGKIPTPPA